MLKVISDIRRDNLEVLVGQYGVEVLAKKIKRPVYQLNQLLDARTDKHIGNTLARGIEDCLDLGVGWMDVMKEQQCAQDTRLVDKKLLAESIELVDEAVKTLGDVDAESKAAAIILTFDELRNNRKVNKSLIGNVVMLHK